MFGPRGQSTAQSCWQEILLTWLLDCEGDESREVLCPLVPAVAGVKEPLLHTAVIGPAVPHGGILDGEEVETWGRALQVQPAPQVAQHRQVPIAQGALPAQLGHCLLLRVARPPDIPLHRELGRGAGPAADLALQGHPLVLEHRDVLVGLVHLQAVIYGKRPLEIQGEQGLQGSFVFPTSSFRVATILGCDERNEQGEEKKDWGRGRGEGKEGEKQIGLVVF